MIKNIANYLIRYYMNQYRHQFIKKQSDVIKAQTDVWHRFLKCFSGTELFKDLKLDSVYSYQDYLNKIPAHDYGFYEPYVEKIKRGKSHVLTNSSVKYIALSSGTSGVLAKDVPYTAEMLNGFKQYQKSFIAHLGHLDASLNLFNSHRLTYGSQPLPKREKQHSIPNCYISGIFTAQMPFWIKPFTHPSSNVFAISDWDKKIDQIIKETKDCDIHLISGIPSYILNIFKSIKSKLRLTYLKEIWPNISTFLYSSTPIDQYRDKIDRLAGKSLNYYGLYLSTEAPMGFEINASVDHHDYCFCLNTTLFSFKDVDHPQGKNIIGLHELKVGGEYIVHIGSVNGFIQYTLNDCIKVTANEPFVQYEILGRFGDTVNIAVEKVSHNLLLAAYNKMRQEYQGNYEHFFVYPNYNDKENPCYEWVLVTTQEDLQHKELLKDEIASVLDESLMEVSDLYRESRLHNHLIDSPVIRFLPSSVTSKYFLDYHQNGQLKMKSIFKDRDTFESFLKQKRLFHI